MFLQCKAKMEVYFTELNKSAGSVVCGRGTLHSNGFIRNKTQKTGYLKVHCHEIFWPELFGLSSSIWPPLSDDCTNFCELAFSVDSTVSGTEPSHSERCPGQRRDKCFPSD